MAKLAISHANLIQLKSLKSINVGGDLITFDTPKVMGIINITPDSFYQGSRTRKLDEILQRAHQMVDEGAFFLDVGGYSSRPGAEDIPVAEEISRIKEPITQIRNELPSVVISVDTFRVEVAQEALMAGANIVNDISGGKLDENMVSFITENKIPYIAMHMKGSPRTMMEMTEYEDLPGEIIYYFSELMDRLVQKGFGDLIVDPGFGFAKNVDQSFELLNVLELLQTLNKPIMVGLSRKSMIYKTLGVAPENALNGTSVLNALALYKGADILRVHDVKPAAEAIRLVQKMREKA